MIASADGACVNTEVPLVWEGEATMDDRNGWKFFAGIMIMVGGLLNAFDGLVAITQARYFEANVSGNFPITDNVKHWGWAALILGVILVLAGLGILLGEARARMVGIVVASLNLIFQFAYLGHNQFWSFTMIVIDILVIYGLAAHGEPDSELEQT